MLVSPAAVADAIAASVQEMQRKGIADLEAAEEKWDQAVRTGNASALEEVFADEFIDTTAKGQVLSKSEYVSGFRKDPPRVKSLQVEGRQVRLFGNVAVVTGKFRTVTIEKGKEVIEAGRFTDVWIRRKNRWQCVAAHSSTLNDHSRRVTPWLKGPGLIQ